MTRDDGSRYDRPTTELLGAGAMAAIAAALAAIAAWPWAMFSTVFGGAVFLMVLHTQFIRPWRRRRKLRHPFKAHFVITARNRFELSYAQQDDKDHIVKELVVPPNAKIPVQILLEPKVSFMEREIYFGCEESLADEGKPQATEYFVPFVREGVRRSGKPDAQHPGHYTDYHGFYHVRQDYLYTNDARIVGFMLETKSTGTYPAQVYTVGDEVRGRADLTIKVEQPVQTKMRCESKTHRKRGCLITPTGGA